LAEIRRLAKLQGVPLAEVDRRRLDRLVGPDAKHQGVVAQINQVAMLELNEFLATLLTTKNTADSSQKGSEPLLAILAGIEDPQNLGALVRVAECAGVDAILLPTRRSACLTSAVARTSAGAIASLPIVRIGNIVNAIEHLKKLGFWIVGLEVNAPQEYFDANLVGPLAIVIGNEGHGLGRLVAQHCDLLLHIPLFGKTNSLNASVAAGIVLYEVVRQRIKQGP
jgi:23S rRNA (guanosine2251-2'-O)-methyltransferase